MRQLSVCAAILFAALIGCGPAKELPDEIPKAEPGESPGETPENVPTQSDPAAKTSLDRAVKAITGDMPDRLKKAKVSVSTYRGSIMLPNTPAPTPATLRWEIAWPDRLRATYDLQATIRQTFFLRRGLGWRADGPTTGDGKAGDGNPADIGRILTTELAAQAGVILGLTLTEPQLVAFEPRKTATATTVKVKVRALPVLDVTFEEPSGLPVRVEYHPRELGQIVNKMLVMSEHKPTEGLMLPTKIEFTQNGRVGEQWTLEKWEFPEKIDDARFDPPRP